MKFTKTWEETSRYRLQYNTTDVQQLIVLEPCQLRYKRLTVIDKLWLSNRTKLTLLV